MLGVTLVMAGQPYLSCTMTPCRHVGWLRVIENQNGKQFIVEETDRLRATVQEMPDPNGQTP